MKIMIRLLPGPGLIALGSPFFFYLLINGLFLWFLKKHPFLLITLDASFFIGYTAVFLLLSRRFYGITLRDFGLPTLKYQSAKRLIEDTILCSSVWLVISWASSTVFWRFLWQHDWISSSVFAFSGYGGISSGFLKIPLFIYFVISAAFVEELFFRGVLKFAIFSIVRESVAPRVFVFVSSVLFGLAHWEGGLTKILSACCEGVVAARLYLWLKNLWPLVAAHLLVDIIYY